MAREAVILDPDEYAALREQIKRLCGIAESALTWAEAYEVEPTERDPNAPARHQAVVMGMRDEVKRGRELLEGTQL
jgi:hypothetical protein